MAKTVSTSEAARRLGYTLQYIYSLLYTDKLPGAAKVDGKWKIPVLAIADRLKSRGARNA